MKEGEQHEQKQVKCGWQREASRRYLSHHCGSACASVCKRLVASLKSAGCYSAQETEPGRCKMSKVMEVRRRILAGEWRGAAEGQDRHRTHSLYNYWRSVREPGLDLHGALTPTDFNYCDLDCNQISLSEFPQMYPETIWIEVIFHPLLFWPLAERIYVRRENSSLL